MRGKFVSGVLVGAAASMFLMPDMDRGTKRRIKKTAKVVRNAAGDAFEDMKDWAR